MKIGILFEGTPKKPGGFYQSLQSILLLNDGGKLGIRIVINSNVAKFIEITILEDSEEGLWVTDIPEDVEIIIQGQGFVEDGQEVLTNRL